MSDTPLQVSQQLLHGHSSLVASISLGRVGSGAAATWGAGSARSTPEPSRAKGHPEAVQEQPPLCALPRSRIQSLQHPCTVSVLLYPHYTQDCPSSHHTKPRVSSSWAPPGRSHCPGRKEGIISHAVTAITRSWHRVLGVSHPLPGEAVPRVLVSHPSSVPAAAYLPLAHSSCRDLQCPLSGAGRRLLTLLQQPTLSKRALLGRHSAVTNIWERQEGTPFLPNSFSLAGGTGWGTGLDRHKAHSASPRH